MSRSRAGLRSNKISPGRQSDFNPFSECFRFFSSFACGGPWSGRHFYTRKERIEALERTKKRLQDEIAAIDEMIADLRSREPKQA